MFHIVPKYVAFPASSRRIAVEGDTLAKHRSESGTVAKYKKRGLKKDTKYYPMESFIIRISTLVYPIVNIDDRTASCLPTLTDWKQEV